jgi:hypothetical protein
MAEGEGIVCLVELSEYYKFITDEAGERRQIIFDANVREYEGAVEVNKEIRQTLNSQNTGMNFWWLNNGITIVASKAPLVRKTLTLENPKVVNGLQTSQEIHKHFGNIGEPDDNRLILVRVIVTVDDIVRNAIIKATNSQTKILPYSLRATEQIHQDIEEDFKHHGLFYDRQKNYYKNLGKARSHIVTVPYLAQAVAAIILQEPNNSRGRPTNLIKDDEKYKAIFNNDYDIRLYLKCARLMRLVDEFLRDDAPEYIRKEKTNIRFQLVMFIAALKTKMVKITPDKFVELVSIDDIDTVFLIKCANEVWDVFDTAKQELNQEGDRVAKSKEFDQRVITRIRKIMMCYKLTESSFDELKNKKISETVLENLINLADKDFITQEEFLDALENQIGKEQTNNYKELILKHAETLYENPKFEFTPKLEEVKEIE